MAERCSVCGRQALPDVGLDDYGRCDKCIDELVAEEHAEQTASCSCETCISVRARHASAARMSVARAYGGISAFGHEVLGPHWFD